MNRIKKHLKKVYTRIKDKTSSLEAMTKRYEQLLNLTDNELKIENSNNRLLPDNFVFNSTDASKILKEAILERKLGNYSQDEFEDKYKQISYGITSRGTEKSLEVPENLDIVPKYLDVRTCILAGHKQKYLLQQCRTHLITKRKLLDIIEIKNEYGTNFPTMLNYLEKGYSIKEIGELLRSRDLLRTKIEKQQEVPTLVHISAFYEKFGEGPIDADDLSDRIVELHNILELPFSNWSIQKAIKIADDIGATHFENVKDYFEGYHQFSFDLASIQDYK